MAITWLTPKTNWKSSDSFEPTDYNRIKNNLLYVNEHLKVPVSLRDMGIDFTLDQEPWNYEDFNKLEDNLHAINSAFNGGKLNIGFKKTFYPNGAIINATELNRIESSLLTIKETQEIIKANQRRLPIRFGTFKEARSID